MAEIDGLLAFDEVQKGEILLDGIRNFVVELLISDIILKLTRLKVGLNHIVHHLHSDDRDISIFMNINEFIHQPPTHFLYFSQTYFIH
jgi:hypothetical protein